MPHGVAKKKEKELTLRIVCSLEILAPRQDYLWLVFPAVIEAALQRVYPLVNSLKLPYSSRKSI